MADEAQGTSAPANTETTPAAPDKPRVKADELPPEALKERLESAKNAARREFLAELGVTDTKDVRAALEELKRRQDAEKSELERATARAKELEDKAKLADSYSAVIANRAAAELAGLNEKHRAFVTAEAGNDPAKQLATIDRLRGAGLLDAPAPVVAPVTPAAPVAPPPANTAPPRGAPPEAGAIQQSDVRAEFERIRARNPIEAAYFAQRHAAELFIKP